MPDVLEQEDLIRRSMTRRAGIVDNLNRHPSQREAMLDYWAQDIVAFCNDLCWTFDPRLINRGLPAYVPFDLYPKQAEYLRWLEERCDNQEEFVVEKSRDVGLTWLNCVFAVHKWLFRPGFKTCFGANKAENVDRLGVIDTIFEKMRLLLARLPTWAIPWYEPGTHATYMRFLNPENDNVITGESGDNMGRGGRSSIYVVDEAAHVERAQRVDAAIVAVADCRGWVSSVYGDGGLFATKRHSGLLPVFTFHFTDDPRKDATWEKRTRASTDEAVFAQEYDIDYAASVPGLCIPAKYVRASRQLAKMVEFDADDYQGLAGLDVGGGGTGKSIYVERFGPWVLPPVQLPSDAIDLAHDAIDLAKASKIYELKYDSVGVGHGVASVFKRERELRCNGVNVGSKATLDKWPDGQRARQKFSNLKAELWYIARDRLEKAHALWLYMTTEGVEGVDHPLDEVMLLPDHNQLCRELSLPKADRLETGKIQIEQKKALAVRGIPSPDYAEAVILTLAPEKRSRPVATGMKVITSG